MIGNVAGGSGYEYRARILPVLLTAAPAVVLAGVLVPNVPAPVRVVLVSGAVAAVVAAQLSRDRGQRMEPELFQRWGGAPTTVMLRYAGSAHPAATARRHAQLQSLLGPAPELPPNRQAEEDDPDAADAVYALAAGVVRALTRDADRFHLVAAENRDYGFRRNVLGLRRLGLTVSWTVVVASVGAAAAFVLVDSTSAVLLILPLVSAVAALVGWRNVTDLWVRRAARNYARALLETVEILDRESTSGS